MFIKYGGSVCSRKCDKCKNVLQHCDGWDDVFLHPVVSCTERMSIKKMLSSHVTGEDSVSSVKSPVWTRIQLYSSFTTNQNEGNSSPSSWAVRQPDR